MNNKKLVSILKIVSTNLNLHKDKLTDLDRKIGDGDHGNNITRGFDKFVDEISKNETKNISETLLKLGNTLLNNIGGASGALYGMAFIKCSKAFKDEDNINYENFKKFLKISIESIQKLGQAKLNDKTMLDVWINVEKDFIDQKDKNIIIDNIANYVFNTKDMMAKKGRASFLRERSIGTIDPGALSSQIILIEMIKGL